MADKDKQPQQKDFDKAWDNMKKGKGRLPYENDMGPIPKKTAPTPDYEGEMGYSPEEMAEVEQARKRLEKQGIYKKGGAVKKMASGGKVSQLAKANGIAVRGKTRGTIC